MTKFQQIDGNLIPVLGSHLGGTSVVPAGGTVSLVIPAGANCVYFRAEGVNGFYAINGTAALGSYGYIPVDSVDMVGPIDNMGTVSVFQAAGGTIHTQFYSNC